MYSKALVASILATAAVAASGPDMQSSDFPQACRDTCNGAMDLWNQCDDQHDNNDNDNGNWNWNNWSNDSQFQQCMCQGSNANTDLPNCDSCVRQYPVNSQNGGNNRGNEVQRWMQFCGFQQQNNVGTTTNGVILPTPTNTPLVTNGVYNSDCRTWVYTSTYNNNGNNNNYLATPTECSNQPGATGGYYGSSTSWSTEYYQTTQNGQVYQQTALVGVGPDGARQTVAADGSGNLNPQAYDGAAPKNAWPLYAVAGGFLMAAFAL